MMKKYKYAISLLFLSAIISLTGCSNTSDPLENKTIPESTTVSITTAEQESSVFETTSESKIEEMVTDKEKENISLEQESSKALTEKEETTTAVPLVLQGYLFESNGISIGMHEDAEQVLAVLGSADAYFETPSCAFLGMDRQYTYGSYMLTTYEENGREYIYDIYFLDENISTPEGIRIGSGIEDMVAAYGDGYTEDFGMYTYKKERSKLQFLVVDEVITSVDYTALTEE